jgi:hypothetical protein
MRDDLQPGDVLMYRAGNSFLGKLICTGSWTNTPREALEYAHAGIVVAPAADQGYEMNPPASRYTVLSKEDWSKIDVFRPTVPVEHATLADWCARHAGTKYPYDEVIQQGISGLFARLGLLKISRWIADQGPADDPKQAVCSATVCLALNAATGFCMQWPRHPDDMRPADIPLGNLTRI